MKRFLFLMLPLSVVLVFAACGGGNNGTDNQNQGNTGNNDAAVNDGQNNQEENNEAADNDQNDNEQAEESESIEVELKNGDEDSIGNATLEEVPEGVKISLDGHDIPKGTHAFHIHEKGVCEAPDFESAEGHFNPDDSNHGFDDEEGPHAGDLPNIVVGENGEIHQSYIAENVTLKEGEDNSLFTDDGTSLVIHEGADDGKSQPAGDAGDRIGCGVIEK